MRVDYALRQHEQWYKGDGAYGDGPEFHWDYYNSFVIHPMLLDVLDGVRRRATPAWKAMRAAALDARAALRRGPGAPDRARRQLPGRSADRSRIAAARSTCSAQMALRRALPDGVSPAQVRGALTAVIRRTLDAPDTFDADGWLRIGFCGPPAGRRRDATSRPAASISAPSAFLPLGLPPDDPFWSRRPQPWTARRLVGPARSRSTTRCSRPTIVVGSDSRRRLQAADLPPIDCGRRTPRLAIPA